MTLPLIVRTAPRTLVIELPLPPRECSPNYHGHWRPKAAAVKSARYAAYLLAWKAKVAANLETPLSHPVTLSAEFYLCRKPNLGGDVYHPRDCDNSIASLKNFIDGITDACIILSDAAKNLKIGEVRLYSRAKEHQGRSCVVITLTEAAEATP